MVEFPIIRWRFIKTTAINATQNELITPSYINSLVSLEKALVIKEQIKHGKDRKIKRKILKTLEIVKLEHIYKKQERYLAKDRELLFDSTDDHLQHTPNTLNKLAKNAQKDIYKKCKPRRKIFIKQHEVNFRLLLKLKQREITTKHNEKITRKKSHKLRFYLVFTRRVGHCIQLDAVATL